MSIIKYHALLREEHAKLKRRQQANEAAMRASWLYHFTQQMKEAMS